MGIRSIIAVCAAARAVGRVTSPPLEGRRSSAGPLPQVPGPAADTPVPPIDCLDSLQQSFQAAGLSKGAASLASKARRSSTRYTYNSRLVRFSSWCLDRQISPLSAPLDQVAEFLYHFLTTGCRPIPFKATARPLLRSTLVSPMARASHPTRPWLA